MFNRTICSCYANCSDLQCHSCSGAEQSQTPVKSFNSMSDTSFRNTSATTFIITFLLISSSEFERVLHSSDMNGNYDVYHYTSDRTKIDHSNVGHAIFWFTNLMKSSLYMLSALGPCSHTFNTYFTKALLFKAPFHTYLKTCFQSSLLWTVSSTFWHQHLPLARCLSVSPLFYIRGPVL